ncbi:TetR/AcrR family transcriptional regulator [Kribbella deserti]|uniref:TetR/AcrR family transcriptional regulator n=1 Tax=Kribbella deserti TaxID=1926257 RepID=A0ABV6QJ63_9ACTN
MIVPNPDRRSERARRAILSAALELCVEESFARLTMEGVAKRAGVGKQTIYRWWPSKSAVLLEAIDDRAGDTLDFPDTGDLVADLRTQMIQLARTLTDPVFAASLRGLIAAAQSDADAAESLYRTLMKPRVELCAERLKKAQQAGQVRPEVAPEDLIELLYAPLYYRLLLQHRPIDEAQIGTILDLIFPSLAPA